MKKKPLVVGELVLLKYKVAKNFVLKGKSFLFLKMLTNLENLKHRWTCFMTANINYDYIQDKSEVPDLVTKPKMLNIYDEIHVLRSW